MGSLVEHTNRFLDRDAVGVHSVQPGNQVHQVRLELVVSHRVQLLLWHGSTGVLHL